MQDLYTVFPTLELQGRQLTTYAYRIFLWILLCVGLTFQIHFLKIQPHVGIWLVLIMHIFYLLFSSLWTEFLKSECYCKYQVEILTGDHVTLSDILFHPTGMSYFMEVSFVNELMNFMFSIFTSKSFKAGIFCMLNVRVYLDLDLSYIHETNPLYKNDNR